MYENVETSLWYGQSELLMVPYKSRGFNSYFSNQFKEIERLHSIKTKQDQCDIRNFLCSIITFRMIFQDCSHPECNTVRLNE